MWSNPAKWANYGLLTLQKDVPHSQGTGLGPPAKEVLRDLPPNHTLR
jgi:hypothetical protein